MVPWRRPSWLATAPSVDGIFFPLRPRLGLNARQLTPTLAARIVIAAAETRSFRRAVLVLRQVGDALVSAKTVERVVHDVGRELAERRDLDPKSDDALAKRPAEPPPLAVVECDGGRIRCRQPGQGPGVHLEGTGWRENKNACLIRATHQTFDHDPQPEPPACFLDPQHVAQLAETAAPPVAATEPRDDPRSDDEAPALPDEPADWRPQRLVRTVLSSLADPRAFGRQMQREARRRRFDEAQAKVYLGDGLPWNWSIWKTHFGDYTPILDFIHALSYLFATARAVHAAAEDAWAQYEAWMRGAWRGEIEQVLEELSAWQTRLGLPPEAAGEDDPRRVLASTIGYLTNNRRRMDYAEYRRQGLPVTTAWMESLVKEINYRVKGTEMFWNDPEGAEAILQVRAAALSDDDRLVQHLRTRPGSPFTRQPKPRQLSAK